MVLDRMSMKHKSKLVIFLKIEAMSLERFPSALAVNKTTRSQKDSGKANGKKDYQYFLLT